MPTLQLDEDKIARCIAKLREEYYAGSVIEETMDTKDFDEVAHGNLEFLKLGRWVYVPRMWFTDPTFYPDLVFSDIGRGLSTAERRYVVERILSSDQTRRIHLDTAGFDQVRQVVRDLRSSLSTGNIFPRLTLFAPIDYYVAMHMDWAREARMPLIRGNELFIDDLPVKVFWSNKYADFDDFILFGKSNCRWVVKPNVRERLAVQIFPSETQPDNMELKTQLVFNLTILNPREITLLQISQRPQT